MIRLQYHRERACFCAILFLASLASSRAAENFLPEQSKFTGEEVSIPMRDGKQLAADVYRPKEARNPIAAVLVQTPYDKNGSRAGFKIAEGQRGFPLYPIKDCAIVITDWRGRAGSAGALTPESVPGGS